MDYPLFLRGLILGFSIAAPVGPIGVLCIRRTLAHGRLHGFVSGLGAATADMLYGAIAAFGLTAISNLLAAQQGWLRLAGGIFLLYLGARTFFEKPAAEAAPAPSDGLWSAFISTLFLTLTNPITIFAFVAIFAGLGVTQGAQTYWAGAAQVVLGVFLGSAAWWLILSGGVGLLRDRFTPRAIGWINRTAGVVIFAFGLLAIVG
ncbi:MAG: LysE family transporter [Anaerolineales bacterium]